MTGRWAPKLRSHRTMASVTLHYLSVKMNASRNISHTEFFLHYTVKFLLQGFDTVGQTKGK